ncbi:MAG: 16S rRNA (adenine(1518)-N(6)/adenine(1519)-N(6))-dimethyltransferase RsmA [Verrucomicrobiota bacterium]
MTLNEIKQVLAEKNLRPLKQLGQNFLFDGNLCRFIAESLPAKAGDAVLEIGPGLGGLTEWMLKKGWDVSAIEIDKGFCAYLKEKFEKNEHFHLIEGDAMEWLVQAGKFAWVIGNLPYNISTPLLAEMLQLEKLPEACVLTLQKEVGERLSASPRTKEYGATSVLIQSFYEVESLKTLGSSVFFPEPMVSSTVIRLTKRKDKKVSAIDRANFYNFVRQGFSQRRKMIGKKFGLHITSRAEELLPEEWWKLYETAG